jgi:hypothetical protein
MAPCRDIVQLRADECGCFRHWEIDVSSVERVRNKVQRMLADILGSVTVDKDGDFIVKHESVVLFVEVKEGFGEDGTVIDVSCPMVTDVTLKPEVYEWVAVEGHWYKIGACRVVPEEDGTGWIHFGYSIIGDDLDESELQAAIFGVMYTADGLDDELKKKFGGKLFTE